MSQVRPACHPPDEATAQWSKRAPSPGRRRGREQIPLRSPPRQKEQTMFVLRIISKSIKLTLIGLGLLVTVIAIALASSGANKKAAADFPVTQPAASQPATSTGKKAKSKPAKPAMTVSQQEAIQSA